ALIGFSDASTALDAGGGLLLVADDEFGYLQLFDPTRSGRAWATAEFRIGSAANQTGEIDFESSARRGNQAYFLGSPGNKKDGDLQTSRRMLIATQLTGSGTGLGVRVTGSYRGLRDDLVAWDVANGNHFGLQAATQAGIRPDRVDGFNIEGAEFAPGDSS